MQLLHEMESSFHTQPPKISTHSDRALLEVEIGRSTVMSGNCRNQRPPSSVAHVLGEHEGCDVGVEQPQPPCTVVVLCGHAGWVVFKPLRVEVGNLGLEFFCEFADVVQSQKVTYQRLDIRKGKLKQPGYATAIAVFGGHESLANGDHIKAMIR